MILSGKKIKFDENGNRIRKELIQGILSMYLLKRIENNRKFSHLNFK